WTFYERYYVARLVDAEGVGLAEPLVTEIVAEPRLDSVTPEFSTDTTEGTLEIAWQPVADASEYLVVLSTWHPEQQFRVYRVLGSSEDTAWSSAELADPEENPREQNSGMQLFTGPSEDLEAGADHRPVEGVELGVLAVNGPTISAYAPLPAPAFLGDLPYEVATKTMQTTYPKDLASLPLSDFPTGFPVTTLAGDLRNTAMRIDPDSIEKTEIVTGDTNNPSFEPGFAFRATGVGTTLESPRLVIRGTDRAALDREIAEYNERALRDHP
ncbi:hypothetical protein, partial [Leucobacter sp. M11]|uniref:hypothetical protein n=1 Tax=Leucobacter sp. M11 TaxID=2993565 RepID=UPI002D80F00C